MKRKILFISAFCIYLAAVFFLCLMKPDDLPQTELMLFGLPADKVAHFLMFFPFPVLGYCMMWKKGRRIWLDLLIVASTLIMGTGLAFLTEHLQALTQYRSSDIKDIYSDVCGMAAGCIPIFMNIIYKIILKR